MHPFCYIKLDYRRKGNQVEIYRNYFRGLNNVDLIYLSIYFKSIYLSIYQSIYLSIYLPIYLSLHLSI